MAAVSPLAAVDLRLDEAATREARADLEALREAEHQAVAEDHVNARVLPEILL